MSDPPPLPPEDPANGPPSPSPYDPLLARYLVIVPDARLFVGAHLALANWAGIEIAFGDLLALVPKESILAVYDDSAFGRGRKGFVVTDEHLLVVQGGKQHLLPLADLDRFEAGTLEFRLYCDATGAGPTVALHVDEAQAYQAVDRWLLAVKLHNEPRLRALKAQRRQAEQEARRWERAQAKDLVEEKRKLPARQALKRLERLIERKRLGVEERAWLIALAEKAQALEAARLGKKRRPPARP